MNLTQTVRVEEDRNKRVPIGDAVISLKTGETNLRQNKNYGTVVLSFSTGGR